jgi:tetratricopeptide (TPR) repeat protein
VTRVADGLQYDARAVSGDAYAAYARASVLEAAGDDEHALAAYGRAEREDPHSPEIAARVGAVACRLARARDDDLGKRADSSFARALELDPHSATAWIELARCANRRGDSARALEAALRGVDADAGSVRAALLVAELVEQASDFDRARAWLDALVVREPDSRDAWLALAAFAERRADLGRRIRAEQGLSRLGLKAGNRRSLAHALTHGRLEDARSVALELRIGAGELAVRAVQAGRLDAASTQAELVLGANPDDADAWIAAVAAADLQRNLDGLRSALGTAPEQASAPSPAALELLGELLDRMVGPEAKAAWQSARGERGTPNAHGPSAR